jgi:hypothetical protein
VAADAVKAPRREAERVLETVATVSEQPPANEPHVEAQSEPEQPRRKGWWNR